MVLRVFFVRIFRICINLKMMFVDFLCKYPKKGYGGALCVETGFITILHSIIFYYSLQIILKNDFTQIC